ncbi:FRG domain-containing protein [Vitreoscilla stercoraria]|uniref:FRG domain-containing protein n=1 Tax=Vitreoscilla stercoraria TaxID=61 RepID=A0ABY4E813_VITST|nr:FRG domain-containing protein [Vitreoscilla stercoraria]UOO91483.1 FRG domain-containing protein [Vitreoscilla stercoraria]
MQQGNYQHIEEIKSVSDYMRYLESLTIEKTHTLFFRGSANHEWENKPSIFRKAKPESIHEFVYNEDHLYYDTLARCSDNFKHCDNTFENLVMMQHYGIPTRLLDITENPLVALYFACAGHENDDAKVDIFQVENTEIKRYDSDTVAMLANVVKMPSEFDLKSIQLMQQVDFFSSKIFDNSIDVDNFSDEKYKEANQKLMDLRNEIGYINCFNGLVEFIHNSRFFVDKDLQECLYLKKKLPNLVEIENHAKNGIEKDLKIYFLEGLEQDIKWLTKWLDWLSRVVSRNSVNLNIDELMIFGEDWAQKCKVITELSLRENEIDKGIMHQLFNIIKYFELNSKCYNHSKAKAAFRKYTAYIQSEKPYFLTELMKLEDIAKVVCVKPKQDNPHIIRQSGAFFIFGINEEAHDKLSAPSIPDQYLCRQNGKTICIHIPKDSKSTILKQLKALAISEGTLFTDIEKVAADLKERYGK